jgi:hypothetical protein
MLKRIADGNKVFWLIFHAVLGGLSGYYRNIAIGWIYIIMASTLVMFLSPKKQDYALHYFFCYYVTYEIFGRMLYLSPYIPAESGKYLSVLFLTFGIIFKARNNKKFKVSPLGLAICVLSIPSIFLMRDEDFFGNLVFSWLGIFDLGLYVIYFSNFTFSREEWIKLLRLIVLPVVSISAYIIFNGPSLDEINFTLSANSSASGHFGPNQVSSIYGVGIFVMATTIILGYRVFNNRLVDIGILLIFVLRGLLTVSRGGLFSCAIAILPVYFLSNPSKSLNKSFRKLGAAAILLISGYLLFQYINRISGDALLSRYEGKTAEVAAGGRSEDFETVTDGRSTIILAEWKIFTDNIFLGVGPGQSTYYWNINANFEEGAVVISHTEFSRLLAEHGIPGLIICLLLLYPLYELWIHRKRYIKHNYAYYLNLGFLLLSLSMCTHSSMRTMITPFFFGFAFAMFKSDSSDISVPNAIGT